MDGPCKIVVTSVNGNQVKIGIEAPKETIILREEIWLKKQKDQAHANDKPPEQSSATEDSIPF